MYDILIIGGGPAGVSAGIYAASRGAKTLLLEKAQIGGIIGQVSTVTHYAAVSEGETGQSFAQRMEQQALRTGVEIRFETVQNVRLAGPVKTVRTETAVYQAHRIILANGTTPRKLGIPGENHLKGVGLNASQDGPAYAGKNIYVVGGGDGAVKEALYLAQFAKVLTLIHFETELCCIEEFKKKLALCSNIRLRLGSRLTALYGKDRVETLEITQGQTTERIQDPGCGIFIYAGATPNTELYTELSLEDGYIPVNDKMETALPGVYAAGDIRVKQVRQVATAVADGAVAAINAAAK